MGLGTYGALQAAPSMISGASAGFGAANPWIAAAIGVASLFD
jgi:hypothetical protein